MGIIKASSQAQRLTESGYKDLVSGINRLPSPPPAANTPSG
jgi:hypothetical protein